MCILNRGLDHPLFLIRNASVGAQLGLLLHHSGLLDTKPILENMPDILQWQTFDFGVKSNNEHPAQETDTGIEAKRSRGRHLLHHGQERACDDDVTSPAGDRVHHGAESSNLEGKQLGAYPADCGYSACVKGDVHDDCYEDEDSGPVD